jgi:hypothetical protein
MLSIYGACLHMLYLESDCYQICITITMLIESLCSTDMLSTDNPGLTNDVLLRNIGTTRNQWI